MGLVGSWDPYVFFLPHYIQTYTPYHTHTRYLWLLSTDQTLPSPLYQKNDVKLYDLLFLAVP